MCVCARSYLMTTVELLGVFWVFRLVEIRRGNLIERRRSREHELRQPGSLLVIGPKLRSWEHYFGGVFAMLFFLNVYIS